MPIPHNYLPNTSYLPYLAIALVGLVWGSNFIFMKLAASHITPMQIVLVRVLFGFLPIALFAASKKVLKFSDLKHAPHFIVMGLLATVIYYFGFAKGTSLLSSGIAGAISGAIPLFTLCTALFALKEEKVTLGKLCGAMLGFIGVVVLARPFNAQLASATGSVYMVLGSISVGVSFVYAKRFITPLKLSALALTTYQLGAGLIILCFITDFEGIGNIANDTSVLLTTFIGLGLFGTGIAYLCYYFIIEKLGALVASSVTYIPPIVALAIGAAIVGENIEVRDYAATGLILLAVTIISISTKREAAR